jgi:hypothetical protein
MMNNLWQDYCFLTREMAAFIARQELDMFYELQNQRLQLQQKIDENGDYSYLESEEGRKMVDELQATDARIASQLRGSMSRLTQQRKVQRAYHSAYGGPVGGRTDFSG